MVHKGGCLKGNKMKPGCKVGKKKIKKKKINTKKKPTHSMIFRKKVGLNPLPSYSR